MRSMLTLLVAVALMVMSWSSGCGEADTMGEPNPEGDTGPAIPPEPPILEIVNMGTKPVLRLYVHSTVDNYRSAADWLSAPLAQTARVERDPFVAGAWYVTAVREKVDGGELIAITSAEPFYLAEQLTTQLRYELWLLQGSFRMYDAVDSGQCHICWQPDDGSGDDDFWLGDSDGEQGDSDGDGGSDAGGD